ncbi:MAG TPA: hypothetical protein DIW54_09360 [Chitinophagaceae bacterium]|nr:hypothetical protein [Chitinophagaceae bacterium]
MISIITEIYAFSLARKGVINSLHYNIYNIFEVNIYLLILSNLLSGTFSRKAITIFIIVFNAIAITRLLFINDPNEFDSLAYAIGCFFVCCSCTFYYYELFTIQYAVNLIREPSFWLVTALFFYFVVGVPIYGVLFQMDDPSSIILADYMVIINSVNFISYFLINIALVCQIRYNKPITLR